MEIETDVLLKLLNFKTFLYDEHQVEFEACSEYLTLLFSNLGFKIEQIRTSKGVGIIGKYFIEKSFPHIHFNGHYDVVPSNNDDCINFDKKTLTFLGRGCSDMKGGIVAIYLACKKAIKDQIKCNISFSLSPDEETGGLVATKSIVENIKYFLPKDALIIIADSSYPNIIATHRGAFWAMIKISLQSTLRFNTTIPSSFEIMCDYYKEILQCPNDIDVSVIGGICNTSNAANLWVHTVSFSVDYRFDVPMTCNKMNHWMESHIQKINQNLRTKYGLSFDPITFKQILAAEPCQDTLDFSFYLEDIKKHIKEAEIEKGKGFYDLRYFREADYQNSFVFGPGEILNAHVKEETLNLSNIINCVDSYDSIVKGVENGYYKRNC